MDAGSLAVAVVTLVLFVISLFEKGMTHDVLLETGVFLISVKLMMLANQSRKTSASIERKLDRISARLERP